MSWVNAWKEILVPELTESLQKDCAIIFNSRAISENENYSTGSTYFIKANETPNNSLEAIAKAIFEFHTKGMTYDVSKSGAEWWSQVIHPQDDIGTHWDRDYGLEEEDGLHEHPHFGTVTYLSSQGAPTVVFNKVGSKNLEEPIIGNIEEIAISNSSLGNHLRFNGNLLHAAPAEVAQFDDEEEEEKEEDNNDDDNDDDDDDEEEDLDTLLKNLSKKRITFLVNIWINHIPSQSQRYEHNSELPTLSNDARAPLLRFEENISRGAPTSSSTSSSSSPSSNHFKIEKDLIERKMQLQFNQHDILFDLHVPLPSVPFVKQQLQDKSLVFFSYPDQENQVSLELSPNQLSEDEGNDANDEDSDIVYEEDEEEGDDDEEDYEEEEEEQEDELEKEHQRKKARK